MPEIKVDAQIFDLTFHPKESVVYAALLDGGVKAFRYDQGDTYSKISDDGDDDDEESLGSQTWHEEVFSLRPSKRSCRGLALTDEGDKLYSVGKGKAIYTINTTTGKVVDTRLAAHEAAINRIKYLKANLLSTGDDDGVVKLWDPRKPDAIRTYNHHFDFISDFMWINGENRLVVTSGDGSLSVIDVKSSKTTPFAHSEDQEDELLSVVSIRGGAKTVVGTQLGILSIFNKSSGWGDCVDRVPGHPHSIDALCNLPSSYPSAHSTILTGSSDGLLRAVQLFPTELLGVITDHGDYPIERIAIDRGGEGTWVGSVGHDEILRMTNLKDLFEDENKDDEDDENKVDENDDDDISSGEEHDTEKEKPLPVAVVKQKAAIITLSKGEEDDEDEDSNSESDEEPMEKKRKRKVKDPLAAESKKKKFKGEFTKSGDPSFFSGL